MKLLLDTSTLLWLGHDDPRLGAAARAAIASADTVMVSDVSLWEVVIKHRVGKLGSDPVAVIGQIEQRGLVKLAITRHHLRRVLDLPMLHGDPFDHLLFAQALVEGATFVTGDRMAERYDVPVIRA